MDISTLTPLINAFRAETQNDSITPDSLGQLLQKIINVLQQAGEEDTLQQLLQWKNVIATMGYVLTGITLENDDENNVFLMVTTKSTTAGAEVVNRLTLRGATTEHAGVMRAQQVESLNDVGLKMKHVGKLQLKVEASPTEVQLALYDLYGDVFEDDSAVRTSLPVATKDQAGIISAEMFKKIGDSSKPFFHIECVTKDGKLFIKYPDDLRALGYIPYLLRWSRKKPRYRSSSDKTKKFYGPIMRGWHLFYNEKVIKLTDLGQMLIAKDIATDGLPEYDYTEDIRFLFGDIRPKFIGPASQRELVGYKVGFGTRTHLIKTNHRFRFGIVFSPKQRVERQGSLDFSKCVTNIAEFYVNIRKTKEPEYEETEYFGLSYSI